MRVTLPARAPTLRRRRHLAYRGHDTLAVLRPGGHAVITARPDRRHGELIDIPGIVEAARVVLGSNWSRSASP